MTAIIFDCDGVLVGSEVLALEIERTSMAEIGLEFDLKAYQKRHLGTTSEEFFWEIEKDYQAKFREPLPSGFRKNIKEQYREAFSKNLPLMPGIHETLAALHVPLLSPPVHPLMFWWTNSTELSSLDFLEIMFIHLTKLSLANPPLIYFCLLWSRWA